MRVQSQFIEMFGNPLSSKQKNELKKLGECCCINPRRPNITLHDTDKVSFVPMSAVSEDGHLLDILDEEYGKVKKGFTYFENNDVLFAKITPCMENGKGAIAQGLTNGIGMGSTEFHVLRPINEISSPYWLLALTQMPVFRERAAKNMSGTGGQKRVAAAYLEHFMVGVPSIEEQRHFEAIYKQADKSKFVGFKSQFIEMFGNHSSTPVSDYIADNYPGEWGVEDKDGSGVKVIRTTNFTNAGKLDLSDVVTRSIIEKKVKRKTIKKFDTILERSGGTAENPVGRVVLFEEDDQYLCNNFTQVLRFKDIDPRYAFYSLFYYYQMNKTYVRSMGSKTTGIQNLDMNKYLEIGIPNASDDEQSLFIAITEQADKSKFELRKSIDAIDQVIKSLING